MAIINKKDYSENPKEYVLLLRRTIPQVLPFKIKIIDCQFAKSKMSLYVLIINLESEEYYHLRISNHSSRFDFYQGKTFYANIYQTEKNFKEALERFFLDNKFKDFSYKDFFALSVLSFADRRGIKMYVEINEEFLDETHTEMIYYSRVKHRWHDLYSPLGVNLAEQFRELFTKGQLLYVTEQNDERKIYVTSSGMALLSYFRYKYYSKYLREVKDINWHEIELPIKQNK